MNAKTRTARKALRTRTRTQRAAARITRRGNASLTTHGVAQGLTPADARSMAQTLRKTADKLHIEGSEHRVHAGRRMRTTHRFTPAQVALIATVYRPRKPAFKAAAAQLRLAA
ncbi:hypothetical protein OG689_10580 [Kitasatospora sp. NBC_00240]|uniref:hypothetical protein n=1 Tax=Kitasatospora sp. NBC_00240 TaxID=2903567 RepID=UPI002251AC95|nr:hypothetical protein [Kitasatospora sp. NBC_00240]MCX5209728.1 hypothetical protein [Kitasatospora sp. NBC_00240]